MLIKYLKNLLWPETANRLQIDVDLTDIKAIRRAIHQLYEAIPQEDRYPSLDRLLKRLKSPQSNLQMNEEQFLAIIQGGLITEIRPQTHPRMFEVFEYLHTYPSEVKDLSSRQLERLSGVSKTYCQTALANWERGLDVEYAEFKKKMEKEL